MSVETGVAVNIRVKSSSSIVANQQVIGKYEKSIDVVFIDF